MDKEPIWYRETVVHRIIAGVLITMPVWIWILTGNCVGPGPS